MNDRQKTWLWLSAAVFIVVGFLLLMGESSAGLFLVILGITCIGASTRPGQTWASYNPRLMHLKPKLWQPQELQIKNCFLSASLNQGIGAGWHLDGSNQPATCIYPPSDLVWIELDNIIML